jgi:solute carrier family 27 fatty acid transporter 1/4
MILAASISKSIQSCLWTQRKLSDTSGTYKLKKVKLQNEGYDIHQIRDKVYFFNSKECTLVPLTDTVFQSIQIGTLRF